MLYDENKEKYEALRAGRRALVLESGEFSHSESGKNDRFWFKENSHT